MRFFTAEDYYNSAQRHSDRGHYKAAGDCAYHCMIHAAGALLAYDNPNCTMKEYSTADAAVQDFRETYIRQRYHDPRLITVIEAAAKSRCNLETTKEEAEQHIKNAGYFLGIAKSISKRRVAHEHTPMIPAAKRVHNLRLWGNKRIASKWIMALVIILRCDGLTYAEISGKLFEEHCIRISQTTIGKIVRGRYTPQDATA